MSSNALTAAQSQGVTVGLCTYRRLSVADTLWSIANQDGIDFSSLTIVVVDNDEELSGKVPVEQFSEESGLAVTYVSEPAKNISAARNQILKNARGRWLAFIDDDEIAEKDWLAQLLETAIKYEAEAVIGKVLSGYPETTPEWIRKGGFFDRQDIPTGTALQHGNTGCALVNIDYAKTQKIEFDLSFGLTGGEDSDFFFRIYKRGGRIIRSNEAVVSEMVEEKRLNERYLTLRAQRSGQCWVYFQRRFMNRTDLAKVVVKSLAKMLINTPILITQLPLGKHKYLKPWLKIVDSYGKMTALLGGSKIEVYK